MSPTEKSPFADLLLTAYRFAGKTLTADGAADWWVEFESYPLAELDAAFRAHRRVSPYLPRPYDIYEHLEGPTAESLDRVAGLLEGPDASAADRATAQRFHEFAESLRTLLQDARATERAARETQRRQRQAQEDAARRRPAAGAAGRSPRSFGGRPRPAVARDPAPDPGRRPPRPAGGPDPAAPERAPGEPHPHPGPQGKPRPREIERRRAKAPRAGLGATDPGSGGAR